VKEIAVEFMTVFSGLERAFGIYEIKGTKQTPKGTKKDGRGRTLQEPLSLVHWQNHLGGRTSIGVIPLKDDETCQWGCIDVDEYPVDMDHLQKIIKDMQLPLVPCMTKSGGVHLFLFTTVPVPAFKFQSKLNEIAAAMGRTKDEIFPKQYQWSKQVERTKQTGNWLNMPYFGGHDTTRYAINKSGDALTPIQFIQAVKDTAITEQELDQLKPIKKSRKANNGEGSEGSFWDHAPPCLVHMKLNGIPEGTRNDALFSYGVLFRKLHPESEEWRDKLQEVNKTVCHKPLSHAELNALMNSLEKSDYHYKCTTPPLVNHCQSGVCVTRRYGIDASEKEVELSGLRKYLTDPPLWHLDVEGQTLVLETRQMHNFSLYQQRCMEVLNVCPPDIKKKDWVMKLNALLQNVQEIEVPPDMTKAGLLQDAIEEFCKNTESSARVAILAGAVYRSEETKPHEWWFRGRDLVKYIKEFKGMKAIRDAEIFNELKELGAHTATKYIDKGAGATSIWILETPETAALNVSAKDFKLNKPAKDWEDD
tara:strand:- start:4850 stop:6451 length:1602 start_codon:yes stop_codon:yes gene_type:complete